MAGANGPASGDAEAAAGGGVGGGPASPTKGTAAAAALAGAAANNALPSAPAERDVPLALSLFAALFFASTSIALVFVNKWGITLFPLTNAILLLQLVLTLLLFAAQRAAAGPAGSAFPAWDPSTARNAAPLAAVYLGNIVFSLMSLKGLNLPMYLVLRRNTPLACMLLKRLLFGGAWPSRPVGLSVLVVCAGSIVAGYSNLDFDLRSYSMAIGSCFLQATYMLLVEMKTRPPATAAQVAEAAAAAAALAAAGPEGGAAAQAAAAAASGVDNSRSGMYYQPNLRPLSEGEMMQYNSLLSLPVIFLIALATGELSAAPQAAAKAAAETSAMTLAVALLGCAGGGLLLNYATMLCTSTNSALTTTVVGVLKGVVGTLGGFFALGGARFTRAGLVGVLMNTAGGVAYSWAKFDEKRAKRAAKALAEEGKSGGGAGRGGKGGGSWAEGGGGGGGGGGGSTPRATAHRAAHRQREDQPLLG
jgi:solute carrier family 35